MMITMWGGWSYSVGEPEHFDTLDDACCEYVRRMSPSVTFYPCWGECSDDDIVIVFDECEGLSFAEVVARVDTIGEGVGV